jgi:flavodoxin I
MSTRIGLFYGSNTDMTMMVAEMIKAQFAEYVPNEVDLFNIADVNVEKMLDYENLIIGCPTWYVGQLQEDWGAALPEIADLDLTGKRVALYGLGDQFGYSYTFADAIGILGEEFEAVGAELVGFTVTDGFNFEFSKGVEDGVFLGLALDEDNESDLTPGRVAEWVAQLTTEFRLEEALVA